MTSSAPTAERAVEATARSRVYGLLSLVFRREPNEGLLAELGGEELRTALSAYGTGLPDLSAGAGLEEIAAEYARLFLVPSEKQVSPFESVQSSPEGELMGPEAVDVTRFLRKIGLTLSDSGLLPDHVAVELDILSKLADAESEAWSAKDGGKAEEYREAQRMFLEKHLGRWFPRFARDVIRSAELPFYRGLAEFAAAFVADESKRLNPG